MAKIKVYLEREDKTKTINLKKPTVENLLKELKINPVTVIVTKNNEVCTEKDSLNSKDNIKIISVPLTDIAVKLGNIKVANTVALGVYLAKKKNIKPESVLSAMKEMAPKNKRNLLEINQRALEEGLRLVS